MILIDFGILSQRRTLHSSVGASVEQLPACPADPFRPAQRDAAGSVPCGVGSVPCVDHDRGVVEIANEVGESAPVRTRHPVTVGHGIRIRAFLIGRARQRSTPQPAATRPAGLRLGYGAPVLCGSTFSRSARSLTVEARPAAATTP